MKLRKGFVSNSSSTSFTCDVCGRETSGWDMSSEEAGMVYCKNGHEFCDDHLLPGCPSYEEWRADQEGDNLLDEYEWRESIEPKYCPACQGIVLPTSEMVLLLVSASGYPTTESARKALCELYPTSEDRQRILEEQRKADREEKKVK